MVRFIQGEDPYVEELERRVEECLEEIDRLKGLGKKQLDRAEKIISQIIDESTALKEENRKARELLRQWLVAYEVDHTDFVVVKNSRAFLNEDKS